jgi:hypothetical protein
MYNRRTAAPGELGQAARYCSAVFQSPSRAGSNRRPRSTKVDRAGEQVSESIAATRTEGWVPHPKVTATVAGFERRLDSLLVRSISGQCVFCRKPDQPISDEDVFADWTVPVNLKLYARQFIDHRIRHANL